MIIFVSHNSEDKFVKELSEQLEEEIKGIKLYFAEDDIPFPRPPPDKLEEKIKSSVCTFVFWTKSLAEDESKSQSVCWELGKSSEVFGWAQEGTHPPMLALRESVTYTTFRGPSEEERTRMYKEMKKIALMKKREELEKNLKDPFGGELLKTISTRSPCFQCVFNLEDIIKAGKSLSWDILMESIADSISDDILKDLSFSEDP